MSIIKIPVILSSNIISVFFGYLIAKAISWVKSTNPTRNLWQIIKPEELVIVVSDSCRINTGEYLRHATGIGQVGALAYAIESLNKAYGNLGLKYIYLSTDKLHDRVENDLLLLGSPKTNQVSGDFLNKISNYQPARQLDNDIYWRQRIGNSWIMDEAEKFHGEGKDEKVKDDEMKNSEVKDKDIKTDYGIVVRAESPFNTSRKRTVVLFSGSHTYGTMAAAKYFVEKMRKDFCFKTLREKNIVVLIRVDTKDGYPVSIKKLNSYMWNKR